MPNGIREYDVVALLDDVPATHFHTRQPLLLKRGQVGTVVMLYDGTAVEVEFSATDGATYALETLPVEKLMVLKHAPEVALS